MCGTAVLLALGLVFQVPSPNASALESERLHAEYRALIEGEAKRLKDLAAQLSEAKESKATELVRSLSPASTSFGGASRFVPLPEVVPPPEPKAAGRPTEKWRDELESIRSATASALFSLAEKSANTRPSHYALADQCLRDVIARRPDHPEARRLLGFVEHNGGWATPYAVEQFKAKKVPHDVYGWVPWTWVPHLEVGELPGRLVANGDVKTWLAAAKADALRREWDKGWTIDTEHFAIKTNVPLSQAIAFGRDLEILHELFESLFADVIGDELALAQRFRSKTMVGEKPGTPHFVSYFATKQEFMKTVKSIYGAEAGDLRKSLGVYMPSAPNGKEARDASSRRGRAYFFRDEEHGIEVSATLYHEVSHQLLFESGGVEPDAHHRNVGNYWVFEGLGTYFETLEFTPDRTVRIGGLVGPRNDEARRNLEDKRRLVPLDRFVGFSKESFRGGDIYVHYQQASALTSFLMHARDGAYREAFLDYVKDARDGRLVPGSGRSLEDRLETTYPKLEAEFRAYLKDAP
jgi:hypothetical protein